MLWFLVPACPHPGTGYVRLYASFLEKYVSLAQDLEVEEEKSTVFTDINKYFCSSFLQWYGFTGHSLQSNHITGFFLKKSPFSLLKR